MHVPAGYGRGKAISAPISPPMLALISLLLAGHAGGSFVHAFECLPPNIPKLRANLNLNGFGGSGGVNGHAEALADR